MAMWTRKRREPKDRHREFIYLDEVSVVSLLAGLQGEIRDSVTNTLARTDESSISASVRQQASGTGFESKLGSTRTSTHEVVRRAVIQSTFRDLWRRDVGVTLHDANAVSPRLRRPHNAVELRRRLRKLSKAKLAVPLSEIKRGDILEMDLQVEADDFFKMVTVGGTFLDLMDGREALFGVSAEQIRQVEPMLAVFRELLVGLIPVRGVSVSHSVIDIGDGPLVVANELIADDLRDQARTLELVGFAEANSFWRDLRRTLFSGATFTAYVRAEGGALVEPWTPVKIADLLASVSPALRDDIVLPLQNLDFQASLAVKEPDGTAEAAARLEGYARCLREATSSDVSDEIITQLAADAAPVLVAATTLDERRRAFDPITQAVASEANRDLILSTRSEWLTATSAPALAPVAGTSEAASVVDGECSVQLEVGIVALYW